MEYKEVEKEDNINARVGQYVNVYLEEYGRAVNDVFIIFNEIEDELNAEKIALIEERVSKYVKDKSLAKGQLAGKIEDALIDAFPWGIEVLVK